MDCFVAKVKESGEIQCLGNTAVRISDENKQRKNVRKRVNCVRCIDDGYIADTSAKNNFIELTLVCSILN